MKKILILVEGQTEETVVRDILGPHLAEKGIELVPVILRTKREKSGLAFKGGVTSFNQVQRDLSALLKDSSATAVTTLLDYYGLPNDFPGAKSRPAGDPYQRVGHVEQAFRKAVGDPRFIPHLTLHELEAWIYVNPAASSWVFSSALTATKLADIKRAAGGAELINEGANTAPSKRLLKLEPAYQKPLHGPMVIAEVGLDQIRKECPHANAWLEQLEGLTGRPIPGRATPAL